MDAVSSSNSKAEALDILNTLKGKERQISRGLRQSSTPLSPRSSQEAQRPKIPLNSPTRKSPLSSISTPGSKPVPTSRTRKAKSDTTGPKTLPAQTKAVRISPLASGPIRASPHPVIGVSGVARSALSSPPRPTPDAFPSSVISSTRFGSYGTTIVQAVGTFILKYVLWFDPTPPASIVKNLTEEQNEYLQQQRKADFWSGFFLGALIALVAAQVWLACGEGGPLSIKVLQTHVQKFLISL